MQMKIDLTRTSNRTYSYFCKILKTYLKYCNFLYLDSELARINGNLISTNQYYETTFDIDFQKTSNSYSRPL